MLTDESVIIDSSTLINLAATGKLAEIVACISEECVLCEEVISREMLFVRSVDGVQVERIEPQEWVQNGIFRTCSPTGDEEDEFVNFAASIDDGEALCLAIAYIRGWALAIDDKKGRRLALASGVNVISIGSIIRHWSTDKGRDEIREVLRAIEIRARYRPPEEDPDYQWWLDVST